jgi:hypothetical protein
MEQQIIETARVANVMGGTLRLFFTFDGRWYRVRTNYETFKKTTKRDFALAYFNDIKVPA